MNLLSYYLQLAHGIESRKMVEDHDIKDNKSNYLKLPSSDIGDHDPSEMIFFTENDLKVGNKIPIYFPKNDSSKSPHLLPRDEASSIPFSSKQLPNILNFFSFPQGSPQAKAMEYTIGTCEAEPIKGETKFCATSLESMLDFVLGVFGSEGKFGVVSTTLLDNSIPALQNYTVLDSPEEISAPKMVACHTLPYPYAVYYCHCQESENKVYKVSLGGEIGGVAVEAVAVCHTDTSNWSRDHAAFRVLGIEPGASPVCHFFPADNLVWLPKPGSA